MITLTKASMPVRASRVAARLAAGHLEDALKAEARIDDPRDAEALHDLRVALRRLRTCLRAYQPSLKETVSSKLLRRLKEEASRTGAGRDLEVQAAWLRPMEERGPVSRRFAAAWLRERLQARHAEAGGAEALALARAGLRELAPVLRLALAPRPARRPPSARPGPSFSAVSADLIGDASSKLQRRLASIRSAQDPKRSHRARIAGKRLRYLIEPLRRRSAAWSRAVSALKGLQEQLGELHDMHVLSAELAETVEKLAREEVRRRLRVSLGEERPSPKRRDPVPGLLSLARIARRREEAVHSRFQRSWEESRRARFFGELASLAESLRGLQPPPARPRRAAS